MTNYEASSTTKAGICNAYSTVKSAYLSVLPSVNNTLARAALFGPVVRLAFHDAGEVDLTAVIDLLGPDGCLANVADSAGLLEPTSVVQTVLEPIWQTVCDKISRADFWVLFGQLVLETAASAPIKINYQYGRRDNYVCDGGAGRLPSGQGDLTEVSRVFVDQMGLNVTDAGTRRIGCGTMLSVVL